jgi:hypothetical protein
VRGESESAVAVLRKSGSLAAAQWKAVVNMTSCSGVEIAGLALPECNASNDT